jgi:MoaA/NifB/PqqE/SkfB family radical SAM enzyme
MNDKATTLTNMRPLDFPDDKRPFRLYCALTNGCNRSCPWCSACSSVRGKTMMTLDALQRHIPTDQEFEIQFEGGEPTIHPRFGDFVALMRGNSLCRKIIVVSNGVKLPRTRGALKQWVLGFGATFTLKLSINHYLLDRDRGLMGLASLAKEVFADLGGERELVLNVRLRKDNPDDKARILAELERLDLLGVSNVFNLQKYGFASDHDDWDAPYIVQENFLLLNPDGRSYGTDMVARSEAMRDLP